MAAPNPELKRTPLHQTHINLGATMVPFGGWDMPVRYAGGGDKAEHFAVRQAVGLFDVSHMGRVQIEGAQANAFVDYVTINDARGLEPYQVQYSAMCKPDGGIVDDVLVYRTPANMLMVINAGNRQKDWAWMVSNKSSFDANLQNVSDETALLALQGPKSPDVLAKITDLDLDKIGRYRFAVGLVGGVDMMVARTGYTGEDGFELWLPAGEAEKTWKALLDKGQEFGILPAGLGARDTLRLEAGYCLYGHEIDGTTNPLEAGLGWITKKLGPDAENRDFVGREALLAVQEQGLRRRLSGLKTASARDIPRAGYAVRNNGEQVGQLVSGGFSPSLEIGIATGYLPTRLTRSGQAVEIDIRGRAAQAEVVRPPRFYKAGKK